MKTAFAALTCVLILGLLAWSVDETLESSKNEQAGQEQRGCLAQNADVPSLFFAFI